MKKLLLVIAAVAMLLPSCKKINEAIDGLDNRLDKLEQEAIPSIDEQIAAINTTLENLDSMDKELKGYIDALTTTASNLQEQINTTNTKIDEVEAALKKELEDSNAENLAQLQTAKAEVLAQLNAVKTELENELAQINATIATLQDKDKELDEKIKDLNDYVNNELTKTTTWVEATFATLEQYNSLVTEIAVIKEQIKATNQSIAALETYLTTKINADIAAAVASLNADIQQKVKEITDAYTDAIKSAKEEITAAYTSAIQTAITTLDNSLKDWVGEQLANYYTIAQIDAMLATMEQEMNGKLEAQKAYLEGLINELSAALTKSIADNKVLIEGLQKDITTLQGTAAEHASRIAQNASTIATNTQNIIDLSKSIYANKEDITANEKAIADNKALIEANAKLIADNAAAIKALQASPDASIVKNAAKIAENVEDIAQNAALISANAVAINNNAVAIANNAADILQLQQNLASAKAEITEAYKTAINDAITTNNGVIDAKIAAKVETINTRIDNEVAIINASIKTLTDRMNVLEEEMEAIQKLVADFLKEFDEIKETIERILSMIQSVSYVPQYSDGKAVMMVTAGVYDGTVEFDFQLSPKSVVSDIVANWQSILAIKAVYTKTRAVSYVDMPILSCVADGQNGIITVVASGRNLGEEFFKGNQAVNAALFISDGNNDKVSDYVEVVPVNTTGDEIIPATEIWYTSVDGKIVAPNIPTAFNAVLLSNTYHSDKGILKFDADVTEIKNEAFKGCANLVSMTLPNTIETIGYSAFEKCSGLYSISLSESLKDLGHKAFYDCTSLRSINIPNGVTKLNYSTFEHCSKMLSVTIPDSITEIEYSTFSNCTSLTRVNISDLSAWCKIGFGNSSTANPLNEGASLYLNGVMITELTIPSDITEIKSYAFYNCQQLKSLCVHNGVTAIGDAAFYNCEGTLFIDSNVVEGYFGYYDSDKRLWNAKFSEMVIGDNVTKIGAYFCKGYGYLTRVTIGNRVSEIGGEAFSGCASLSMVNIKDLSAWCKIEFSERTSNPLNEGADLYLNGALITELIIPSDITEVKSYAFYNCKSLTRVMLPENVTSIRYYAFSGCSSIEYMAIGEGVTSVNSDALYGCAATLQISSKIIETDLSRPSYGTWISNSQPTEIIIDGNITKIGAYQFFVCSTLTKIVIPESVTEIGYGAFEGCSSLSRADIGSLSAWCKIDFSSYDANPLFSGADLYINQEKATDITIPSDVEEVKDYAFYNCKSLTNVTIHNRISSIGCSTFCGCASLSSVTIEDGVLSIGESAFSGCSSLASVNIPASVETFGANPFASCTGRMMVDNKIVENNGKDSGNYWLSASMFSEVVIGNNVAKIANSAFSGYTSLEKITIPNSVLEIGNNAFNGCKSLTAVTIPNSVTQMEVGVFANCENLLSVNFGSGISKIPDSAFSSCNALTNLDIPDNITSIDSYAFSSCNALTNVILGRGLESIGGYAFQHCNALSNVYCKSLTPASLGIYAFRYNASDRKIYVPKESVDLYKSSWSSYSSYIEEMPYTPTECTSLTITANNVSWKATSVEISYIAITNGISPIGAMSDVVVTGMAQSNTFPQNTSDKEVERAISYSYLGQTATTTIKQGVYGASTYAVNLNDNWRLSTAVTNPNSSLYDGVYESYSNYNVNNGVATMYIDIDGYETFSLYVRSDAETSCDYVIVSELDSTAEKITTSGNQNSGTALSNYTLVTYTNIDGGSHRITIKYRKDGSVNNGTDRGYIIIPQQ